MALNDYGYRAPYQQPRFAAQQAAAPLMPSEADLAAQDALEAQKYANAFLPSRPANLMDAPDARLGPLRFNGGGLDSAAKAVLAALQNAQPVRGAGTNFLTGLAGGLAAGRVGKANAREDANALEQKRVIGDDIARRSLATGYARDLAKHRWEMQRDAAKEAAKRPAAEKSNLAYTDITDDASMQRRLTRFGYMMPTPNEKGRVMIPVEWLKPQPSKDKDDPVKRRGAYNSIVDNVRVDDDVKQYVPVRDAYLNGKAASERKTSAGDIMLMRYLAKISDPTTGVREEEFKTFERAQGVLARYGIQLTKAMWGKGQLNEFGRTQLMAELQSIYDNKRSAYEDARDFYRAQAEAVGINPDLVVRDYRPLSERGGRGKGNDFDRVRDANGRR